MSDLSVRALAGELQTPLPDAPDSLGIRPGTVTALSGSTATVNVGGVPIPGITYYRHAIPRVGDVVELLYVGRTPRILGVIAGLVWHTVGASGEPAFQNSWVQEFNRPLSFSRDAEGFVHLRGKARNGTGSAVVFTLPSGYRPAADEDFVMYSNGAAYQGKVTTTGDVSAYTPSAPPWATFSGITFVADGS